MPVSITKVGVGSELQPRPPRRRPSGFPFQQVRDLLMFPRQVGNHQRKPVASSPEVLQRAALAAHVIQMLSL
jgi:hypothetical protein